MKPYIIRKCKICGYWHLYNMNIINDTVSPQLIMIFDSWWDDGLMVINFPKHFLTGVF